MAKRVPTGPPPAPVVQRIRLRYAKRGRLRFISHRDFARAFERALRRAQVPMAYSAGFTPHPKISYIGAAPTGVASEAEYVEIGLARAVEPEALRLALDAALPPGLDLLFADAVTIGPSGAAEAGAGSLAAQMQASDWLIELPGISEQQAAEAVAAFLAQPFWAVERMTKTGKRTLDARAPIVRLAVRRSAAAPGEQGHAILSLVMRQLTPAVRPDDVLAALRGLAGLAPSTPPLVVRRAQGPLSAAGVVLDPFVGLS